MKALPVIEFDPGQGKEYAYNEYPDFGLYHVKRLNLLVTIYYVAGSRSGMFCTLPPKSPLLERFVDLPDKAVPTATAPATFTEEFVLRLAAVAQRPELAQTLTAK